MTLQRGLLWCVAFAMVAAQALGLMHRLVHAPHAKIANESIAQQAHAGRDSASPGLFGLLFSGHEDDSTCRLFDPLTQDGAPAVPAVAMPLVLSSFFLQWFQGEALVRWAALFDARGPPSLR